MEDGAEKLEPDLPKVNFDILRFKERQIKRAEMLLLCPNVPTSPPLRERNTREHMNAQHSTRKNHSNFPERERRRTQSGNRGTEPWPVQ